AASAGVRRLRVVAGEGREVRTLVRLVLEGVEVIAVVRAVHDLDDMPAERRLDRRQDVAWLEAGLRDGRQERRIDGRHGLVEVRQLAACAGRAERRFLVTLLARDRVEQARIGLELGVGGGRQRAGPGPG